MSRTHFTVLAAAAVMLAAALLLGLRVRDRPHPAPGVTPAAAPAPPPPDKPALISTASGLQYRDLVVGKGASPKSGATVAVNYTGWLADHGEPGKKFDSSYDRNQPFKFTIGAHQVIAGWNEGVLSMHVGGKRRLIIPPSLGYGAQGVGPIPGNATMI